MPEAQPDDGRLDVYVASPHRLTHWVRVFIRLITRRPRRDDHVDGGRPPGSRYVSNTATPTNSMVTSSVNASVCVRRSPQLR